MRRRRSRSYSRSPESSRSRGRRSPSEYRSMTRSRSPSPARSRSRDRGRPLRSIYARSSRSRSPPAQDKEQFGGSSGGGGRPPSRSTPISTIDLTKVGGNDAATPWLDSAGPPSAPSKIPPNFNKPPPNFGNPPAQVPPMESQPIPSVGQSQMRFPPPSRSGNFGNFQADFQGYGSSFYPGENRNYPDGQQLNNFNAMPGQTYAPQMDGGGWNYPGHGNPQSGFDREFQNAPLAAGSSVGHPPPGVSGVPPGAGIPPVPVDNEGLKNAAVQQEMAQQRKALAVQREEYFKKRIAMTKDLKALREQAETVIELGGSKSIIKENNKLQDETLQKIKSMDNVIDMLTQIIGDREQIADLLKGFASALEVPKKEPKSSRSEKRRKSKSRSRSRTPSRKKEKKSASSKKNSAVPEVKINVEHYDPELHWCSSCNVFPRSAVEYLTHLHSDVHRMGVRGRKSKEKPDEEFYPWRVHEPREPSPPTYKDAPSKRVPIRGVPFLVPATAWYCSLCRTWLGELELANRHLRGPKHASTYTEFVSQNPHWEVDWLRDRTRAYEKNSEARAKVEEISKQLGSKKDKVNEVHLDKLKEMLASVKKAADKGRRSDSSGSSRSDSSSSEESDREDKRKSKKKKAKEEDKKKKKKKPESNDGDREGAKSDYTRKGSERKEMSSRERRSEDRSDRREQRPDRSEYQNRNFKSNNKRFQGRGRGSAFRGRPGRGGRGNDRDTRPGRGSTERYDRRSRDRDSDDGSKTDPLKSPLFRGEHDWDRVKPPSPEPRPKKLVVIGKRPGTGGTGISRDRFAFDRQSLFERLDKDKPDELYGPLEPPKNG